jgi:hypothetical protein
MPLRDHFHPPLGDRFHWEEVHGTWVSTLVRDLNFRLLPARYRAAPTTHLGTFVEVDVATFEEESSAPASVGAGNGAVATAVWAPSRPTRTVAVELPAQDVFEVRVYDDRRGARLVAAVEFVSPRNKDRPDARRDFAVKCAAYLQQQVAVVVVDVVADRLASLHAELMRLLGPPAAAPRPEEAPLYTVAYRNFKESDSWRLDLWYESLALGAALPVMPLWLASDLAVPLELEATYEETCRALRLP